MVVAYDRLFSSFELGGIELKNRIIHPSMSTGFVRNGQATDSLINYYANRAGGGASLIISEPMNMHAGQLSSSRLDVHNSKGFNSLKRLVEAVRKESCHLLGQIQDGGRGRHEIGRSDAAIGASALPDDISWTVPHELNVSAIVRMTEEFCQSSLQLKKAGFAGVEISAGHGHLFHQFFSLWSNHRQDQYGGDIEGRTRIVRDLIDGIRSTCGKDFIIGLKMPGGDEVPDSIDAQEARNIATAIAATGEVDFWSFAWGTHADTLNMHLPDAYGERAPYTAQTAELRTVDPTIPTAALGYITDPNEAERLLGDGTADLIMLGRALITDPAWPNKSQQGREAEIRYCVSCNTCWRTLIEAGRLECDNNPRVGKTSEADWWPEPVKQRKRIVVIGAGIAGMEAAWLAGARGHEVFVMTAGDEVGGKTRLHAQLPGGENLSSIYDYQLLAAKRAGINIETGFNADLESVLSLQADSVVLATGSHMSWPSFLPDEYRDEGFFPDLRELVSSMIDRKQKQSGRVVIFDKDHTEMTYAAAEFLEDIFDEVVLITPRERIAGDVSLVNRQGIYQRLYQRNIRIITSSAPCAESDFENGCLTVANIYNANALVLEDIAALSFATPRLPNNELLQPLLAAGLDVHMIGDCYAPRSVLAATRDGHKLGNTI